jgi:predicted nucleotide-binding protein (sugar kinase/HSP70/actin superfamily)
MFNKLCRSIIHDFDNLPITNEVKPRVGIVGEILVKFSPAANNYLVETLEKEGAEAVVPDLLDFFNYSFYNLNFKVDNLGFAKSSKIGTAAGLKLVSVLRSAANSEYRKSKHFTPSADIAELAKMASPIVSTGNQTGEGWFLTGEMLELIHNGAPNIVCIQPFACLPNHIVGKGVIKEIRRRYPEANIAAVDYDPGASEVNQLNRIKLMLTTAEKRLEEKTAQN